MSVHKQRRQFSQFSVRICEVNIECIVTLELDYAHITGCVKFECGHLFLDYTVYGKDSMNFITDRK